MSTPQNTGGQPTPIETSFLHPSYETITSTEYAVVLALRDARRAEMDWSAYRRFEALMFLRTMLEGVEAGEPEEELRRICDPEEYLPLREAAGAVLRWIERYAGKRAQRREQEPEATDENPAPDWQKEPVGYVAFMLRRHPHWGAPLRELVARYLPGDADAYKAAIVRHWETGVEIAPKPEPEDQP